MSTIRSDIIAKFNGMGGVQRCVVLFYLAMNMELLLLLHEVEQMHSLVSPLRVPSAGPSVPPLILASVSASSFLASPLGFLQSLTQDILRFVFR